MKTIHLCRAAARQATLVLILFLTATGLWAQTSPTQTPPTQMTPAQIQARRAQMRNALTNKPAVTPAGLPSGPGFSAPPAGAPAPGAPATAPATTPATTPAYLTMTPAATAVTPDGGAPEKEVAGYDFNFPGVDVNQVLEVYANLVGRTLLRAGLPQASITLKTQTKLTKTEAIQALQAVLALNGITVIPIGEKFVKVLPPDLAGGGGGSLDSTDAAHLPDLGTYVTHITQLKYVKPSAIIPIISPLGRLKDILPLDDNGILVIRDYAENVKRMLEMIDKIDISVPAVYISEVIPIRYAQADDIANALNSLGGSGGGTVSVGSSGASPTISGLAGNRGTGLGGMGGMGGMGATQPGANPSTSPFGQSRTGLGAQANPNGTPSSTTPFGRRLLNIINQAGGGGAGGQEPIQVFGQAKIIADERANSLLVFATRQDMDQIKHVISQLDVLLAQVLIESVIIDYSLGPDTLNFGVSASQNKQTFASNPQTVGLGGMNNGQTLLGLLGGGINGITNSSAPFGNSLPGGLSYFGNIGPKWDVALAAAATDSHASIIQRPRIQTSQAKAAQFFVGDTVPYVTGTYNYGGAYGNQSSYSQLSVGVELDVTPFINPDGLVVMQIQQEIDDLNGSTHIDNVGDIPNTIKRTLNSEIAVRDKDTVMLGGFIKNSKSTTRSGVPLLQDIPLLGNLFSSRSNKKGREELIVLMRPTVLKTPEIAAANTIKEEQRLPNVSRTMAEEVEEQRKSVEAERRLELKHHKTMSGGAFNTPMPATNVSSEQLPPPQARDNGFFTPVAPNAPVVPADAGSAASPTP
ncbi:MAG: secretin N-terminal domain-containing protein [Verrucomicrobiota bacterium]